LIKSNLEWIQNWFSSQVNGEWEHHQGIQIESLDNPGWRVVIDLNQTSFESKKFEEIKIEEGIEWASIRVTDGIFEAFVSINKLDWALKIFRKFIEE